VKDAIECFEETYYRRLWNHRKIKMPSKNKPKRLDRNTAWRVARRKKKRNLLVKGNSRNRKPRPKHKGVIAKVVKKAVAPKTEKKKE